MSRGSTQAPRSRGSLGLRPGAGSLPRELELAAWRKLLLSRLCEEKIRAKYMGDEMKTPMHLGVGGEAISVGVCLALPRGARCFGTYRNHSLFLSLSEDCRTFFGELYGRASGSGKGKAGSMHLSCPSQGLMATSAVVGTTIPLAVGAAFAQAYRGKDGVSAAFFGDGATEEGVFWESLNFALLKKLRVLFICEDNGLAINTLAKDRRGYRSLVAAARAFGCRAEEGDGSDLVEVYSKARAMLSRMKRVPGPGLLRLSYFRYLEHVGINEDFQFGYRKKPSDRELKRLDPVARFEGALLARGRTRAELEAVRAEAAEAVDKADEAASGDPFPGPEELYTDVFHDR